VTDLYIFRALGINWVVFIFSFKSGLFRYWRVWVWWNPFENTKKGSFLRREKRLAWANSHMNFNFFIHGRGKYVGINTHIQAYVDDLQRECVDVLCRPYRANEANYTLSRERSTTTVCMVRTLSSHQPPPGKRTASTPSFALLNLHCLLHLSLIQNLTSSPTR
jgi:hypothetical protein